MSKFDYKTPTLIRFVQDYVSPLNAIYAIQVPLAALLDVLSPYAPLLFIAVMISLLSLVYHLITLKHHNEESKKVRKTAWVVFSIFSLIVFSSSALANYKHRQDGGLLADLIPTVKTWQDKYLIGIKHDTEEINAKLDKQNEMLQSFLTTYRPQLEKPLIEEIPHYKDLPENQKQALLLFTSKVGVNGIKKYHGLIKAVNNYTENKTQENAKLVADHFNYIARIDGKDIKDEKSKKLLSALFLDPDTYEFILADGKLPPPQNPWLLKMWGIDMTQDIDSQITDPLGDFIKELQAKGLDTNEQVVIPQAEEEGIIDSQASNATSASSPLSSSSAVNNPATNVQKQPKVHTRHKVAGMF